MASTAQQGGTTAGTVNNGPVTVQPGAAASFGQQGGVTAGTYVSTAPPDRHLSPNQRTTLEDLASSFPDSANTWFSVEHISDDESATLAKEIYKPFADKQRVLKGPIMWMANPNPEARGVFVMVASATDEHFGYAESIANILNRPDMPVAFTGAAGLKPGIVKVLVFRVGAMQPTAQTAK